MPKHEPPPWQVTVKDDETTERLPPWDLVPYTFRFPPLLRGARVFDAWVSSLLERRGVLEPRSIPRRRGLDGKEMAGD